MKISASLPHGEAFVESSFCTTKYVVSGRSTLSLESAKVQKVVLSGIRVAGGAHLVPKNVRRCIFALEPTKSKTSIL